MRRSSLTRAEREWVVAQNRKRNEKGTGRDIARLVEIEQHEAQIKCEARPGGHVHARGFLRTRCINCGHEPGTLPPMAYTEEEVRRIKQRLCGKHSLGGFFVGHRFRSAADPVCLNCGFRARATESAPSAEASA